MVENDMSAKRTLKEQSQKKGSLISRKIKRTVIKQTNRALNCKNKAYKIS
jgi:hypothetical protein